VPSVDRGRAWALHGSRGAAIEGSRSTCIDPSGCRCWFSSRRRIRSGSRRDLHTLAAKNGIAGDWANLYEVLGSCADRQAWGLFRIRGGVWAARGRGRGWGFAGKNRGGAFPCRAEGGRGGREAGAGRVVTWGRTMQRVSRRDSPAGRGAAEGLRCGRKARGIENLVSLRYTSVGIKSAWLEGIVSERTAAENSVFPNQHAQAQAIKRQVKRRRGCRASATGGGLDD